MRSFVSNISMDEFLVPQSKWFVDGVKKYHRKISTLINELINEGFKVEKILEPEAIPEVLLEKPNLINERRRPPFLIINVSKK
jgi:hypothetical protein